MLERMTLFVLVAEGYTDCALLEAILEKYMGFLKYDYVNEMPELFQKLVGSYPNRTGKMERQDMPHFYFREKTGVVVKVAGGNTKIVNKVEEVLQANALCEQSGELAGFLVFTDADLCTSEEIFSEFKDRYEEAEVEYQVSEETIIFENNLYSHSIYVYPQDGKGAVEKILLSIAEDMYPELSDASSELRNRLMEEKFSSLRKHNWASNVEQQEFFADKVQFGTIASALKPDRPVGFAIKDKLIEKDKMQELDMLPEFSKLHNFLKQKLG